MAFKKENIIEVFQKIKVKDVMSNPSIVIKENEELSSVDEKMRKHNIKHLLVVDNQGSLRGIITLNDLFKNHPPKDLSDGTFYYDKADLDKYKLKSIMTKDPKTLKRDSMVHDALSMMGDGGYGCIPIVNEKYEPIGIITQTDIIKFVSDFFKSIKN